jgi:N-acetylglucosaminyldiphosphoundecaprenol N-acetyl-beta-D-mannosaminyltransferase
MVFLSRDAGVSSCRHIADRSTLLAADPRVACARGATDDPGGKRTDPRPRRAAADDRGCHQRDEVVVARRIFGVRIDELPSQERLREACERFLAGDRTFLVFTPNPEILLLARKDRSYAGVLNTADLALPDGAGVALIESLLSRRRVRRWPGVEIGVALLELAAEHGVTVAFLGGAGDVAERAAERCRARVPGLHVDVAGADADIDEDGRSRPAEHDVELVERLRAALPAIMVVGLGAPKQERWIARHADEIPSARIMIGVGGAFDMWAGRLQRAPRLMRRLGLEWMWRLALEPRRLPRIARAAIVFPFHALMDHAR